MAHGLWKMAAMALAITAQPVSAQDNPAQSAAPPAEAAPSTETTPSPSDTDIRPPDGSRIINGTPAAPGSAPWMVELFASKPYTCGQLAAMARNTDADSQRFIQSARQTMSASCFNDAAMASHQLTVQETWSISHRCGGSLIAGGWIVTAAHCFLDQQSNRLPGPAWQKYFLDTYKVRAGTRAISARGVVLDIDGIFLPKEYAATVNGLDQSDIALIHVRNAAALTEARGIRPIALAEAGKTDTAFFGTRLLLTGWGSTLAYQASQRAARRGEKYSSILLEVPMIVTPDSQCTGAASVPEAARVYAAHPLPKGAFCAKAQPLNGSASGGSCQGDSGGPLLASNAAGTPTMETARKHSYVLVGVVSRGAGCGMAGVSSVYTRVSAQRDFIDRVRASGATTGFHVM